MGADLSTRADAASKLQPHNRFPSLAKADGLTEEEARELVTWLHKAGYNSVDVIAQGQQSSVTWQK
jgi:hypothetical protein